MDLDLALHLADLATRTALQHLQSGVRVELKPDGSPVTAADKEIERQLCAVLAEQRPADCILGEEYGHSGSAARRWIIDPIDGTSNFAGGRPYWGTHVALEQDGEIVLGVITRPAYGVTWWAMRGQGAFRRDSREPSTQRRLGVSSTRDLGESRVTVWTHVAHPMLETMRVSGAWIDPDLDAILRLAEGDMEAVFVADGKPWDHAPAVVIVEEAGGRFSDAFGGRRIDLEEAIFSNGRVHDPVLELSLASQKKLL